MKIKDFIEQKREIIQMVYGIALIILVPSLIAINSYFIISKYNQSIDVILQKQALAIGRTIANLMKGDLPWDYFIQRKLELLMEENIEIQRISVLMPQGDYFRVIASSEKDRIGKINESDYYKYAWLQSEGKGSAVDSKRLAESGEDQELIGESLAGERFWLVTVPMYDAEEKKQALLSIKLSSKIVDDLTSYNRNASIFLLVGTVIIVILFLLVTVQLWDYVVLYKKIKEVDRMKDDFISMASHELKTPVTAIRGYSSMMLEDGSGVQNENIKKGLEAILGSSERLMDLVVDLLDVSRIEQGRVRINPQPTAVGDLIDDVVAELDIQARQKNLKLSFRPHAEPLPLINIDPARLRQVLINFINNAIKYTEEGEVEIITRERYMNKILEITVKDSGIGMSNEDRERLFEKFYRIKNDKTRGVSGTGLGLWISKQLVELMNGLIVVDSIEGVGTQMTLQFPIIKK